MTPPLKAAESTWIDSASALRLIHADDEGIVMRGIPAVEVASFRADLLRAFRRLCDAGVIRVRQRDVYKPDVETWAYLFHGTEPPVMAAQKSDRIWTRFTKNLLKFSKASTQLKKARAKLAAEPQSKRLRRLRRERKKRLRKAAVGRGGSARSIPKVKYKISGRILKPRGMGEYGKGNRS